jgi:hypothetical protein
MNPAAGAPPRAGAAPLLSSTGLLVRLRLRRLANQVEALSIRKKPGETRRTGHRGKKSSRIIFYIAWPMMMFVFGAMLAASVANLHAALDPPDTFWLTAEFSQALAVGVAFLLLMMWLSSLLISVASGELAKPDWDLEWLITLPVRSDTLIWARVLERSIVQPTGVLQLDAPGAAAQPARRALGAVHRRPVPVLLPGHAEQVGLHDRHRRLDARLAVVDAGRPRRAGAQRARRG